MARRKLKHRVTLLQFKEKSRPSGAVETTYYAIGDRWAEVVPTGGRKYYSTVQFNAEVTHQINMRYARDVTEKMRIRFIVDHATGTFEVYDVKAVIQNEHDRREMTAYCVKLSSQGLMGEINAQT